MNRRAVASGAITLAACFVNAPALALTLGQTDTFATGGTQGWRVGSAHPFPPSVIATGGPGGTGDRYLQQRANGGSGPASHFAVENRTQWSGNYIAAGVTGITMDVANFGTTDLALRLMFDTFSGLRAWSSVPLVVPAGSGWQSLYFPITADDLTVQGGSVGTSMSNVISMRIFHSTASSFPGEAIVTTVGIDNVTAVPEPAAALMLALGLAGLAWRRHGAARGG
jgi:hypothetical protein